MGLEGKRLDLSLSEMPRQWYNILPDLPEPLEPPLDPETKKPISPEKLAQIFPPPLLEQEVSQQRWIDIPEEVLKAYSIWRPTPIFRATRLEEYLGTPAQIYFKYEGVSPAGSHKPNTAIAQAYYNKISGIKRLTTETGAGQWGSALALAGAIFGLEILVFMVRVSYNQKPYRKFLMQVWGADVVPSPSDRTEVGRKLLKENPEHPGSLGIAISEAIEVALSDKTTNYSLGSVLNHVLLHQTIIGLEAKKQMEKEGIYPDVLIGCVGGGSNFAGLVLPFVYDKIEGRKNPDVIAVEPKAAPSITKGIFAYDYGDTAGLTPLIKMYTLGHNFVPPPIHAGGLRYHGMAPIVSLLNKVGLIRTVAYHQKEVFESAVLFSRLEGFLPAPETAHAIKAVIDEAIKAKQEGKKKVILFNFSGHGHFDLGAYDAYLSGKLEDYELKEEEIRRYTQNLPKV